MNDLAESLGAATVYIGLGLALLILSAYTVDLLTPGHLGHHIFGDTEPYSLSAGVLLGSVLLGEGIVIATAIWSNATAGFGTALEWTIAFGLFGVLILVVSFVLADLMTPGKLGNIVCVPSVNPSIAPAAIAAGGFLVAMALIVAASIA